MMTDTPAPAPAPVSTEPTAVAAALTAARQAGGTAYLHAADEMIARGAVIPVEHRKALDAIRHGRSASVATGPKTAADHLRDMAAGDAFTRAEIQRAAGVSGIDWQDDDRTPSQQRHDKAFGVEPEGGDPSVYRVPPSPRGTPMAEVAAIDRNLRGLAAGVGFSADAGTAFIGNVVRTTAALDADPGLADQWIKQLRQIYPSDEVFIEAAEAVQELLNRVSRDNPLLEKLKTGPLRNPRLFVPLANRARAMKAWASTRPDGAKR